MFGQVVSANVVGYASPASRAGFNYITPSFRHIDGTAASILDLQMPAEASDMDFNIQFLNDGGGSGAMGTVHRRAMGTGQWGQSTVARASCARSVA